MVLADKERLFGLSAEGLVKLPPWECQLDSAMAKPLSLLRAAAAEGGFELQLASGFRSFERQLGIWNAKALGERPVLDQREQPLERSQMTDHEWVYAILRWSALPGSSRHHWGTDLDVYDSSRLPSGYRLQLTRAETLGSGPCASFHRWLSEFLRSAENPGFFRPYDKDRGGVAPEPWHLSYAPLALPMENQMTPSGLRDLLAKSDLELKNTVLNHLDAIYARFIRPRAAYKPSKD